MAEAWQEVVERCLIRTVAIVNPENERNFREVSTTVLVCYKSEISGFYRATAYHHLLQVGITNAPWFLRSSSQAHEKWLGITSLENVDPNFRRLIQDVVADPAAFFFPRGPFIAEIHDVSRANRVGITTSLHPSVLTDCVMEQMAIMRAGLREHIEKAARSNTDMPNQRRLEDARRLLFRLQKFADVRRATMEKTMPLFSPDLL